MCRHRVRSCKLTFLRAIIRAVDGAIRSAKCVSVCMQDGEEGTLCNLSQQRVAPAIMAFRLRIMCTYNLGFFFGPGLPLSRGGAFGSIAGGARFRPVIVPPPLLRLASAFGGASEFGSCSSLPFDGIGVELDSDVLSALSGGCTDGDGSGLTTDGNLRLTSDGNWSSRSGDRRSTTILLCFDVFDVDFVLEFAGGIVVDGGMDGGCRGEVGVDG